MTHTTKKPKYLWRVQAVYANGEVVTRHYQSKTNACQWAAQRRKGYEPDYVFTGGFEESGYRPAIPPAKMVVITKSLPIEWESENA